MNLLFYIVFRLNMSIKAEFYDKNQNLENIHGRKKVELLNVD